MSTAAPSADSSVAVGQVLHAMRVRGTTLRAWSLAQGYQPRTVSAVVGRWAYRPTATPHGGIAREIMAALRKEIGPVLTASTVTPRQEAT